jgi:hypothetical protein
LHRNEPQGPQGAAGRGPGDKESYVKHRARASSAGSTGATGKSRGFFRRALATRAASRDAKGSGAPAAKLLALFALVALASLVLGVASASAAAPTVTIDPVTDVGYTTAHVEGTVDPEGEETTYRFEYVTDAQFQENFANGLPAFEGAATGIEGTTEILGPVSGDLTGLAPGTAYLVRLVAENSEGEAEAAIAPTFTTKAVVAPTVSIEAVTTATAKRQKAPVQNPGPEQEDLQFSGKARSGCSPRW